MIPTASTASTAPATGSRAVRIVFSLPAARRHALRGGTGISSRSRTNRCVRSLSRSSTGGPSLAHARERLRDGRADGAAPDAERSGDLLLGQTEVVMRDDDRALPRGEQREQTPDLEPIDHRGDVVARGALADRSFAPRPEQSAPRRAQRDAEQPALEVAVVSWRMA